MSELKLALEVPRWTWRCYTRHLGLVVGLSLIASVQRLVVVNWTDEVPPALATASEVVVLAARVLLLVLVWRIAMAGRALRSGRDFVRRHWRSLLWQVVFLGAAFAVFEVVAEHLVSALLPPSARQTYLAVLLFVKNPTVIALTFLWWIGVIRQVFSAEVSEALPASRR
ncbi:hypothetical protein ACFWN2_12395 [Lentzea sp. NPDC058436]|uniref:hypothetical protein n=1 Tax=Lentzea sp. NPDC058436 TaxID=3346499 RepID=UPI00364AF55D